MIHSPLFSALSWLDHGFGTRADHFSYEHAAQVKQIHSAVVLPVSAPGVAGEGDALVTSQPQLTLAIRTADCAPVLLADPKQGAVAAIHAGWRGTAAHIVPAAIQAMHDNFGTNPADLIAAIGPCIGVCCYEVGPEVARQFEGEFIDELISSRHHLDIPAANRAQLLEAGVDPAHIAVSGLCTFCEAEKFFSYRREKENAGRMHSYIKIL